MITNKFLLIQNVSEMELAEKLGLPLPEKKTELSTLLFWKEDIKRAWLMDGIIVFEFYDEKIFGIDFDKEMWEKLKILFSTD